MIEVEEERSYLDAQGAARRAITTCAFANQSDAVLVQVVADASREMGWTRWSFERLHGEVNRYLAGVGAKPCCLRTVKASWKRCKDAGWVVSAAAPQAQISH